jgi:hypothetical protein
VIPIAVIDGRPGHLFRAKVQESLCFVPTEYLQQQADGGYQLDELAYFQEGWSVRNMRWAYEDADGTHLFPDTAHPVTDLSSEAVREFFRRASSRTAHPFDLKR